MRRRLLAFLFLASSLLPAATTFTLMAGRTRNGNADYRQPNNMTITWSGTPVKSDGTANAENGYVYVDWKGVLNVVFPPGVTGTCTVAGSTCKAYTTVWGPIMYGYGNSPDANGNYLIDAIFNTTNSLNGAVNAWDGLPPLPATVGQTLNASGFAAAANTASLRVYSDQNGYMLGVRFYKAPADTSTTASVALKSDDAGTTYASGTGTYAANGSGWQTILFSSPVAVTANTIYRAEVTTTNGGGVIYFPPASKNQDVQSGHLHMIASYDWGNGSCDPNSDAFPKWGDDQLRSKSMVAPVGCVSYQTNGTQNAFNAVNIDYASNWGQNTSGEGCQCMIGGNGPGPYALINTMVEGSGNMWHHDNSGNMMPRGDYYYYRDIFRWPEYTRLGNWGVSDGFNYMSRQLIEWKGGVRIHLEGMLFENAWNSSVGSSLMMALGNQNYGSHDMSVSNSEFRHGGGVTNMFGQNVAQSPPVTRNEFSNNLVWDISAYSDESKATGAGWFLQSLMGEDNIIQHNTLLPLRGYASTLFWEFGGTNGVVPSEGYQITDNIFPLATPNYGSSGEGCNGPGEAIFSCATAPFTNSTFAKNFLYPQVSTFHDPMLGAGHAGSFDFNSSATQAGAQAAFPILKASNYIVGATDISTYGWLNSGTWNTVGWTFEDNNRDFGLKIPALGQLADAKTYPTTDGKAIGADIQAIRDAQGKVELRGVPTSTITQTAATVVFRAPDAQACPVDYKIHDPADPYLTGTFSRASDIGFAKGIRAVILSGLTAGKAYDYRVDCAGEQPTGSFHTQNP